MQAQWLEKGFHTISHLYPQYARHNWPMVQDAMKAFDHFIWPLGQLMQHLPADITNQASLSAEEVRMCESTSVLADYPHHLLLNGLEAVTPLLALAGEQAPHTLPAIGKLMQYLTEENRASWRKMRRNMVWRRKICGAGRFHGICFLTLRPSQYRRAIHALTCCPIQTEQAASVCC